MKVKGPIATLVLGAVLGSGLLVADVITTSRRPAGPGASTAATVTTAATGAGAGGYASAPAPSTAGASGEPGATTTAAVPAPGAVLTYTGHVSGGGSLAVSTHGGTAVAYLCDGHTLEAWMWGTVRGGTVSLHGRHGAALAATITTQTLTGTVTVAGRSPRSYQLRSVRAPSGLYRATAKVRGATIVSGWVVLADGSQVGVASTETGENPAPAPAIDLATGSTSVGGVPTSAQLVDPDTLPAP